MNESGFTPENNICPDRNERCAKLAMRAIRHFAKGSEYQILDPRFGGLAWNFSDPRHYDHIATAVESSGTVVERADTGRRPGTEQVPTFGLRRALQ